MGRTSAVPDLFIVATGQEDNIGDVVLRREYFDHLRGIGRLHVLLGSPAKDFLDGLCLHESDVVYVGFRQWYSAALRSVLRGPVWFVDKPGQLKLDRQTLRRQLQLLPLVVAIRLCRGQVLRLGMAVHTIDRRSLRYFRALFRLSTYVWWRDTSTRSAFRYGAIGPDWAFGRPETLRRGSEDVDSRDIAVTYRGDRELPADAIIEAIKSEAAGSNRRVLVVAQVRRDLSRSAELATLLNAELVPWPEERTLADHERILRKIYRNCALVVSDRLHALIVGMTEGAVPLCMTSRGEDKIARHLDAVGFAGSTVSVNEEPSELRSRIELQVSRRAEALEATRSAGQSLEDLVAQLKALASLEKQEGRAH